MSDATRFPSSPRQNVTDGPRHDTTVMVMTVTAAAARLGVSPGAVRKRLERGTLNGRKIDGQWRVLLNPDDATRHDASAVLDATFAAPERDTSHDQADSKHDTVRASVVSASAQSQLDAFRDAILRPHLERIEELAKDVGRLTAERNAAAIERDRAVAERKRAEQRLASDRVLLDMMATQADQPSQLKTTEPTKPTGKSGLWRRVDSMGRGASSLMSVLLIAVLLIYMFQELRRGAYFSTADMATITAIFIAAFALVFRSE